jgi:uncharacterized membrane protein
MRSGLQWGFILRRSQYLRLFIVCDRIVYERRILKDLEGSGRGVIKEVSWYFPSVTGKICETSHSNACSWLNSNWTPSVYKFWALPLLIPVRSFIRVTVSGISHVNLWSKIKKPTYHLLVLPFISHLYILEMHSSIFLVSPNCVHQSISFPNYSARVHSYCHMDISSEAIIWSKQTVAPPADQTFNWSQQVRVNMQRPFQQSCPIITDTSHSLHVSYPLSWHSLSLQFLTVLANNSDITPLVYEILNACLLYTNICTNKWCKFILNLYKFTPLIRAYVDIW